MDSAFAKMGRGVHAGMGAVKGGRYDIMTLTWLTQAYPTIAAATALVGIGIGIGKVIIDIAFLKKEAAEIKSRLAAVEKDQVEMKLILKQIAKKLRISF